MGFRDAKKRIKGAAFTLPGLYKKELVNLEDVLQILEEEEESSLEWSVEDFESIAIGQELILMEENRENEVLIEQIKAYLVPVPEGYILYDRSKFEEAFKKMMEAHDAAIGINWDVIEQYLNDMCKIKKDGPVISEPTDAPGHPSQEEMGRTAMEFLSRAPERRPEAPGEAPANDKMAGGLSAGELLPENLPPS